MKIVTTTLIVILCSQLYATDWNRPDPITYEWTIKSATKGKIPEVSFVNSPVSLVIESLGNSMTFPLRIDASQISENKKAKIITIQEKEISWIEVLALVADAIEADIIITKGTVILKPGSYR